MTSSELGGTQNCSYLNTGIQELTENTNCVIVPYGLRIGWLKSDKWYRAKNLGSLGWFVWVFQFDPSLHVAMVREKVHLGELFEQAFSQKIACG